MKYFTCNNIQLEVVSTNIKIVFERHTKINHDIYGAITLVEKFDRSPEKNTLPFKLSFKDWGGDDVTDNLSENLKNDILKLAHNFNSQL